MPLIVGIFILLDTWYVFYTYTCMTHVHERALIHSATIHLCQLDQVRFISLDVNRNGSFHLQQVEVLTRIGNFKTVY